MTRILALALLIAAVALVRRHDRDRLVEPGSLGTDYDIDWLSEYRPARMGGLMDRSGRPN